MDDLLGPDALRTFVVAGDPETCRRSAGLLRDLAAGVEDAAAFLTRQGGGPTGLSGLSGTAYRRRCAALGADAGDLARRTDGLSTALADLAVELDRAREVMARAEATAWTAGLVLGGTLVPPETALPTSPAGADRARWTAWSRARSLIRRARILEIVAQQAWSMMLLRYARRLDAGEPSVADHRPREPERPGSPAVPRRRSVPPGLPEPGPLPGPRPGPRQGPRPDPGDPPRDGGPPQEVPPRDGAPDPQPPRELDPWICVLTPSDPDSFCGTPDVTLEPWEPTPRETEVHLPGVLGRPGGSDRSGVSDRAEQ